MIKYSFNYRKKMLKIKHNYMVQPWTTPPSLDVRKSHNATSQTLATPQARFRRNRNHMEMFDVPGIGHCSLTFAQNSISASFCLFSRNVLRYYFHQMCFGWQRDGQADSFGCYNSNHWPQPCQHKLDAYTSINDYKRRKKFQNFNTIYCKGAENKLIKIFKNIRVIKDFI